MTPTLDLRHAGRPAPPSPPAARSRTGWAAGVVVVFLALLPLLPGPPAAYGADTPAPLGAAVVGPEDVSDRHPDGVAAAALDTARHLGHGVPGARTVPPAVADALGYSPARDLGLASHPHGDCSSPVPLPAGFEPACRVHDLGYDLLRVAHRNGARIPPGIRADLDTQLITQWAGSCDGDAVCTGVAEVAGAAVRLNTLRQRHGAPVEERWPW